MNVAKSGNLKQLGLPMLSEIPHSALADTTSKSQPSLDNIQQEQIVEPFRGTAYHAASHGFAVIPCGGAGDPSGKRPLVKWGDFKAPPGMATIAKWLERPAFRAANLGIVTGLSGVDCDTRGCLLEAYRLFGETPLVMVTPSGGLHLYYRSSGEGCSRFRADGIHGDIKGAGGFIVGPPSFRLRAGKTAHYRFLEGNWSLREILPPIKAGAPPSASAGPEILLIFARRQRLIVRVAPPWVTGHLKAMG